jgi:hypothetical protein
MTMFSEIRRSRRLVYSPASSRSREKGFCAAFRAIAVSNLHGTGTGSPPRTATHARRRGSVPPRLPARGESASCESRERLCQRHTRPVSRGAPRGVRVFRLSAPVTSRTHPPRTRHLDTAMLSSGVCCVPVFPHNRARPEATRTPTGTRPRPSGHLQRAHDARIQ